MKEKIKQIIFGGKIKTILLLVVSFLIVTNLSPSIFIANTPKIDKQFLARVKNFPQTLLSLVWQIDRSKKPREYPTINLSGMPFKKISQGVYAGETADLKYVKVVQSEISWQEIELRTKSGKVIKLRYPKDQSPTQEMLNIIKSE